MQHKAIVAIQQLIIPSQRALRTCSPPNSHIVHGRIFLAREVCIVYALMSVYSYMSLQYLHPYCPGSWH